MKPVRFHDEATAEIAHETLHYNSVGKALAERFVKAVENTLALASEFPGMGTTYKYATRLCSTSSTAAARASEIDVRPFWRWGAGREAGRCTGRRGNG